jgi:hypothetical protein
MLNFAQVVLILSNSMLKRNPRYIDMMVLIYLDTICTENSGA